VGRAADFTVSPSSTRRRVASESVGVSGWFSAHFTIEARSTGAARNPIMGSRPVALLLFAVNQLDDMIERFKANYYAKQFWPE
jgi:hypothetical protein